MTRCMKRHPIHGKASSGVVEWPKILTSIFLLARFLLLLFSNRDRTVITSHYRRFKVSNLEQTAHVRSILPVHYQQVALLG